MTKEEALFKVEGYLTYYLLPNDYKEVEEIINALKQEPCKDCVSRQAVFDAMRNNYRFDCGRDIDGDYVEGNYSKKLHDVIVSLPPVTPQEPRWIPVGERLPKDGEIVLITSSDMYLSKLSPWCGWKNRNNWYTFTANGSYLIKYPIAWMPLPKAYEPQESENKE